MSYMSYCRFENTYKDLQDCYEALSEDGIDGLEEDANQYEKPYIRKLVKLCVEIAEEYQDDLEE